MDEHVTTSNFDGDLEKCSMLSLNMYMHTTNGKRQRARLCFLNAVEMRALNFVISFTNDKNVDCQSLHNFFFTNKRIYVHWLWNSSFFPYC